MARNLTIEQIAKPLRATVRGRVFEPSRHDAMFPPIEVIMDRNLKLNRSRNHPGATVRGRVFAQPGGRARLRPNEVIFGSEFNN